MLVDVVGLSQIGHSLTPPERAAVPGVWSNHRFRRDGKADGDCGAVRRPVRDDPAQLARPISRQLGCEVFSPLGYDPECRGP
jgi:hypothetical protein